jgi:hypothetical protein
VVVRNRGCVESAQDRVQWRDLVLAVLSFWILLPEAVS